MHLFVLTFWAQDTFDDFQNVAVASSTIPVEPETSEATEQATDRVTEQAMEQATVAMEQALEATTENSRGSKGDTAVASAWKPDPTSLLTDIEQLRAQLLSGSREIPLTSEELEV